MPVEIGLTKYLKILKKNFIFFSTQSAKQFWVVSHSLFPTILEIPAHSAKSGPSAIVVLV